MKLDEFYKGRMVKVINPFVSFPLKDPPAFSWGELDHLSADKTEVCVSVFYDTPQGRDVCDLWFKLEEVFTVDAEGKL